MKYESQRLRSLPEIPEAVLEEWGRSYGGAKYEEIGYPSISTIATLMEHRGFRPDSQIAKLCVNLDSISDIVESVVMRLQRQGIDGEAEAHCLRVAYDPYTNNEKRRIIRIKIIGDRINNRIMRNIARREYYRRLASAREFIANEFAMDGRARKATKRVSAL